VDNPNESWQISFGIEDGKDVSQKKLKFRTQDEM
jgi:hypothetical protein